MKDAFSEKECELLIAAKYAADTTFHLRRVGPNEASAEEVIFIGEKAFPKPWTKELEVQYTAALRSLIDGGFATELDWKREGFWTWSLTPKGKSVADAMASKELPDE